MKQTQNLVAVFIAIVFLAGLLVLVLNPPKIPPIVNQTHTPQQPIVNPPKTFQSLEELNSFIGNKTQRGEYFSDVSAMKSTVAAPMAATSAGRAASESTDGSGGSEDYSQTNVQVEGVDEADIVKNDGKYIYLVSGTKVLIVDAYPASNMRIIAEINISSNPRDIFINKDKLIIFSEGYRSYPRVETQSKTMPAFDGDYFSYSRPLTNVLIFDISKRGSPALERNLSFSGSYVDSRMIGDYVYIISSQWIYQREGGVILPMYSNGNTENTISPSNIHYFDEEDNSYSFTLISSINTQKDEINTETYLIGASHTLYVSENNIFLTYTKRLSWNTQQERMIKEVILPLIPPSEQNKIQTILASDKISYQKLRDAMEIVENYSDSLVGNEKSEFATKLLNATNTFQFKIQKEYEKTVIHKVSIDKNEINYVASGEVSGHALNQFSMDEYKGNLRIATTTGEVFSGNSLNHVFILDSNLKQLGSLENLAPTEKIYSARFMGSRGYLVTFKKVDPLFVLDLSNPKSPEVLGYLKIPGYSDYLHPYDENHVIGIGKEAIDASTSEVSGRGLDFAWYQGVKIALFDITDVEHPKEKAKLVIGDRGTNSEALSDHKAFLFNKEKKLLVIPILLAEINRSKYERPECEGRNSYDCTLTPQTYGDYVWQGAYVLNIDLENISVRGKVTHTDNQNELRQSYWESPVRRSLYIGNVLYTLSNKKIKANDLQTVNEVSTLNLPWERYFYPNVVY